MALPISTRSGLGYARPPCRKRSLRKTSQLTSRTDPVQGHRCNGAGARASCLQPIQHPSAWWRGPVPSSSGRTPAMHSLRNKPVLVATRRPDCRKECPHPPRPSPPATTESGFAAHPSPKASSYHPYIDASQPIVNRRSDGVKSTASSIPMPSSKNISASPPPRPIGTPPPLSAILLKELTTRYESP